MPRAIPGRTNDAPAGLTARVDRFAAGWRIVSSLLFCLSAHAAGAVPGVVRDALDDSHLGLYDAAEFRIADGACADCPVIGQALWYFRGDLIAVPKAPASGFTRDATAQTDVREWAKANPAGDGSKPALIWIGSPQMIDGVRLVDDGHALAGSRGRVEFSVTPKIDSNRSWFDVSSVRHFAGRELRLRGRKLGPRFVARTIWPADYDVDAAALPVRGLAGGETIAAMVRAEDGGARQPQVARVLWERHPGMARDWAGKPVLAIVLNGAQGDDDEAHAGHFAIATGSLGAKGEWGDWLVNNFYNLDSVSEKGIIAAPVPMDAYMADLNSGQAWYRPSYLLIAVLKQPRVPHLYQQAIGRVYNHFYRHDFVYQQAIANCAGISVQTLRSLGWNVPEWGATGRAKAVVALPFLAAKDVSLQSGRQAFDVLTTEQTELFPFAAFQAAGEDLLGRIAGGGTVNTRFEADLRDDLEAIVFVRIPQFPSSRAFGRAPVLTLAEYQERVPKDKSQWQIVPVPPRPFPDEMKDPAAPHDRRPPSWYAMYAYPAVLALIVTAVWRYRARRRRTKVG